MSSHKSSQGFQVPRFYGVQNNSKNKNNLDKSIVPKENNQIVMKNISNLEYYNILKKTPLLDYNLSHKGRNVYICLTTIPPRFLSDDFDVTLAKLFDQLIPATKVFVSIPNVYKREFQYAEEDIQNKINTLHNRHNTLEIIRTNDYGPGTKLLGVHEYHSKMNLLTDNDILIVVDDDMDYTNHLVMTYLHGFNLYEPDVCAFDQKYMKNFFPYEVHTYNAIYHDNYKGKLYGWVSFGIKFSSSFKLIDYYNEMVSKYPKIEYHDDLLFTRYALENKLYKIGISVPLFEFDVPRTKMDNLQALRNSSVSNQKLRGALDTQITTERSASDKVVYEIPESIEKRNFYLVNQFKIINPQEDLHVCATYISKNLFLLTLTLFNEKLYGKTHRISFNIKDKEYKIEINTNSAFDRASYIISIDGLDLEPCQYNNVHQYKIIQTSNSKKMCRNKFYSIMTILNYAPEFEYKFFDNDALFNFVKDNYQPMVYDAIQNLNPGAYISDLFRYCYLYLHGGVYMDCKKILYVPLQQIVSDKDVTEIFFKDRPANYCYNSMIVCNKKNLMMRCAIIKSIINIVKSNYTTDTLTITGPGLLGSVINQYHQPKYVYKYLNKVTSSQNHMDSYIDDGSGNKIIKNTYRGYYQENRYMETTHYSVQWSKKTVFKSNLSSKYDTNIDVLQFPEKELVQHSH